MEHCIIEGKRCTACCKVIRVSAGEHLLRWFTDDEEYSEYTAGFMKKNWVMITEEMALRLNPFMVYSMGERTRVSEELPVYFTCTKRSSEGCTIQGETDAICSGYPNYEDPLEDYLAKRSGPEYHPDCTYFKEVL